MTAKQYNKLRKKPLNQINRKYENYKYMTIKNIKDKMASEESTTENVNIRRNNSANHSIHGNIKGDSSANYTTLGDIKGCNSTNMSLRGGVEGNHSANRSYQGDVTGDNSALLSIKGKVNVGKGSVGMGRYPGDKPQGENSVMALTDDNKNIVKIVIRAGDDVEVEFI